MIYFWFELRLLFKLCIDWCFMRLRFKVWFKNLIFVIFGWINVRNSGGCMWYYLYMWLFFNDFFKDSELIIVEC